MKIIDEIRASEYGGIKEDSVTTLGYIFGIKILAIPPYFQHIFNLENQAIVIAVREWEKLEELFNG